MKDRIRHIMESQHMTQQTFAQFLGVSSAALSSIFNGRTKPTLNTVEAIIQKIPNINLDWLMLGQGEMYEAPTATPLREVESATPSQALLDFDTAEPVATPAPRKRSEKYKTPIATVKAQEVKKQDVVRREITEIRVYFDDLTYESFIPDKGK